MLPTARGSREHPCPASQLHPTACCMGTQERSPATAALPGRTRAASAAVLFPSAPVCLLLFLVTRHHLPALPSNCLAPPQPAPFLPLSCYRFSVLCQELLVLKRGGLRTRRTRLPAYEADLFSIQREQRNVSLGEKTIATWACKYCLGLVS